ncbi:MAG: flagellar hook-associated protein FlgK [Clostridia bacterium]|nr:flagellar hook-associated protein FlgK [Clostridia bacterium]
MGSSFTGLRIAQSALAASQICLDVTGQNIANVNTKDYTRQSAELNAVNYNNSVSKFAQPPATNKGQGVTVAQIAQIRDKLLDVKVRNCHSNYNTTSVILSGLSDIENVFDETDNSGLNAILGDFYSQLQQLSNNAGNTGYASMTRSAAQKVCQVFNQYASQLSQIRDEQMASLEIAVEDINTVISKLNEVNTQIKDQSVRGSISNELLDDRNSYLDTLSKYMNITVTAQNDGTVKVSSTGNADVLDSTFSISQSGDQVVIQRTDTGGTLADFLPDEGTVAGCLHILNGAGTSAAAGESSFTGLLYYNRALDNFAAAFAGTFNKINTLDPAAPANLFTGTTANNISISEQWYADANYIVVADTGTNDNVIKMINAMEDEVDETIYPGITGNFEGFAKTLMDTIAIDTGYYKDINDMNKAILTSAANQRESIMGVLVDEETVNLISYQKAYQAAARLMTVMDETLDVLINRMGVVGR